MLKTPVFGFVSYSLLIAENEKKKIERIERGNEREREREKNKNIYFLSLFSNQLRYPSYPPKP